MFEDLKKLIQAEPFAPFRIVLTTGHACEVFSPYQVALGQTQLNYYYPRSDNWAILRQNQIAAFEITPHSPEGRMTRPAH